jgi:hypothetical protein
LDPIYRPTGQPRWEAIWRTLIADTGAKPLATHPAPAEYAQLFRACFLENSAIFLAGLNGDEADSYKSRLSEGFLVCCNDTQLAPLLQLDEIINFASVVKEATIAQDWVKINKQSSIYAALSAVVGGHRRLFRTSQNYLGLGPMSMMPGDEVWLIRDARIPFILQPQPAPNGRKYTLLGECYLHGFMHGEMFHVPGFKERLGEVCII